MHGSDEDFGSGGVPALIDSPHRDHCAPGPRTGGGITDYFWTYLSRCHRPKEELLFAKVKTRDPAGAEVASDIVAEHGEVAGRLETFGS
jgi:hypothetical protein